MHELHEVETTRRGIEPHILHKTITDVIVREAKLRWPIPKKLGDKLIKQKIKANTRLVIVNHASNVIGTIQPIREMGRYCRQAGIPFAVDVSQSAGKIPVDMEDQHLDIVAFTGHKSLLGPTGIGGLIVGPDIGIRSTRWGGTGVKSALLEHLEVKTCTEETRPSRQNDDRFIALSAVEGALDFGDQRR